ncbi:hypothetical protein [Phytohabitans houttuyneae]|uniref:Uncharacterized protein n=1 Tax=Phytohabitans houttuyneae TaxID=1076126 RepID=A0A6V8K8H6_9ACTN|nr:hypothetical protein [Phytohabitans houttuyneae]GFJ78306.1 hypothetical protein Phou_024860 [Phytohabitans houttuyneae]
MMDWEIVLHALNGLSLTVFALVVTVGPIVVGTWFYMQWYDNRHYDRRDGDLPNRKGGHPQR